MIGFAVNNVQDFHLYGNLIDYYGDRSVILYDKKVNKITSPRNNIKILNTFKCNKLGYSNIEECINLGKKCSHVISNEGQPFQGDLKLPFKLIGLSWTMEYYVHGPRFLNLCERFYVDCNYEQLKETYDLSQYPVVYDNHPKYYILNNKTKQDICNLIGLDSSKKIVTFLGPAPAQRIDRKIKDMFKLGDLFKSLGYHIIVKQKPKCPDLVKICNYDQVLLHTHPKYSTSVMLSYVSDFMVGFNTSGVVESIRTNTPFINLYLDHKTVDYRKHPVSKVNFDKLLRLEKFDSSVKDFINKNSKTQKRTDYIMDDYWRYL